MVTRRLIGAMAAALLLLTLGAPAALADDEVPRPPGGSQPPGGGGGGGGGYQPPGGPVEGQVKRQTVSSGGNVCRLVAGPRFIGATCGSSGTGSGSLAEWIESTLAGRDLPGCWHEIMTRAELDELGLIEDLSGAVWVWEKCLHGVHPESFEISDEGAEISQFYTRIWVEDYVHLLVEQRAVVDRLGDNNRVPSPVLGTSPSSMPLVNQHVSFFNAGDDTVAVNAAGAAMRAQVVGLRVETGDVRGDVVQCPGNGFRAATHQNPTNTPQGCWYAYQGSSIGLDQDAFDSRVIAIWDVEVNYGNGWQPFHSFERALYQRIQVNEVQAVVRP